MEPAEGCHLDAFAYLECALGLLGSVQLLRWAYGSCASPRPTYQLPQRLRHAPNRILLATLLIHYAQRGLFFPVSDPRRKADAPIRMYVGVRVVYL